MEDMKLKHTVEMRRYRGLSLPDNWLLLVERWISNVSQIHHNISALREAVKSGLRFRKQSVKTQSNLQGHVHVGFQDSLGCFGV